MGTAILSKSLKYGNPEPNPLISDALWGTIIGGAIGFFSSIVVDRIKNWFDRPKLTIEKQTYEVSFPYAISSSQYKNDVPRFRAMRIRIQNEGNTAAENCKAVLIRDVSEIRVAWMIPKEDRTVTINAHDMEYIDLCAIAKTDGNWKLVFTTEHGYGKNSGEGRDLENWSRDGKIRAKLRISCKNAKPCSQDIVVLTAPDQNGNIVYFSDTGQDC